MQFGEKHVTLERMGNDEKSIDSKEIKSRMEQIINKLSFVEYFF